MRAGLHWPYDVPAGAPDETWRLVDIARPDLVVVMSHAPRSDYERLLALDWHPQLIIRAKTGPQHLGAYPDGILDYREWEAEHSLRDAIGDCLRAGQRPYVTLGCEPDIELAREPVDDPENMAAAMAFYIDWYTQQAAALRSAYGSSVMISPAALSQGAPERFDAWRQAMHSCWQAADWIAEHNYTDGRDYDDLEWAARWRYFREAYPSTPVIITETNDNGRIQRELRAAHMAGYVRHLRAISDPLLLGVVDFILPGGADDAARRAIGQDWWLLDDADVLAWHQAATLAMHDDDPTPINGGAHMDDDQTLNACLTDIWQAATSQPPKEPIAFNPETALAKHWREHVAVMGPACGPERQSITGQVYQAFASGVWKWTPSSGIEQAA